MNEERGGSASLPSPTNSGMHLVRSLSFVAEVFLRTGFGERYVDPRVIGAMVMLVLYPLLMPHYDPWPMWWLLISFMVMCGMARQDIRRRWYQGSLSMHSMYNGTPRWLRFFPTWSERTVKRVWEPLFTAVIGLGLFTLNLPLGVFIMAAAAALFLCNTMDAAAERLRLLDLNDVVIESTVRAEQFREGTGRR